MCDRRAHFLARYAGLIVLILMPISAWARTAVHFDMPTQTLAAALRAVGSRTQTDILFDPRLVGGLRAPALRGTFTVAEALNRLLSGTGIKYIRINGNTVILSAGRRSSPSGGKSGSTAGATGRATPLDGLAAAGARRGRRRRPAALSQVIVTGSYKQQSDESMKLGIAVRDTPFSIESYSHSFMTSIGTRQVADLYQFMTGLQKAGITGYNLTIRGFTTADHDRNSVLIDGLPGLPVRFGTPLTVSIDHIELVKGASSVLYGQEQPGGFINIITKKPRPVAATRIEVRGTMNASRYSRVRGGNISFDSTGPIGSGRVLYRLIGQVEDQHHFRNYSYNRGVYLFPMLTYRIGQGTTATVQFQYRSVQADYHAVGLLAPLAGTQVTIARLAPVETAYTEPGGLRDERGTSISFFLRHRLADRGWLSVGLRSVNHHDYASAFDVTAFDRADPTYQTLDLRARAQWNQRTYNFADVHAVVPFRTGRIGHRLNIGVDAGKEIDDFKRTQFCPIDSPGDPSAAPGCNVGTALYTVSVLNPDFGAIPPPSAFGPGAVANFYTASESAAVYLADLATVSHRWKVLAGARFSRARLVSTANRFDSAVPMARQTLTTALPELGVIFQPNARWSYYANYSTSYSPVNPGVTRPLDAPLFRPTEGRGGEVGFKADLLRHRAHLTGALFLINKRNIPEPYAGGVDALCPQGGCQVQVGAEQSKGAELELDAKPSAAVTLIAGYAYTDVRVTASTAAGPTVGAELPNAARNAFHLWSRYDWLNGPLRGVGVGLGFVYIGARVAYSATHTYPRPFVLPAYHLVDLALYKKFADGVNCTLMIRNLFDETYYQDGTISSGMVSVEPGAPRAASLYLSYAF